MGDLTTNFSVLEFLVSDVAPKALLGYRVSDHERHKMYMLCVLYLETLRTRFGGPLTITSGLRTDAVIEAMIEAGYRPSKTTEHRFLGFGGACDFTFTGDGFTKKNRYAFNFLRTAPVPFGQLIAYETKEGNIKHVHISLPTMAHANDVFVDRGAGPVRLNLAA